MIMGVSHILGECCEALDDLIHRKSIGHQWFWFVVGRGLTAGHQYLLPESLESFNFLVHFRQGYIRIGTIL